jgi:hypothetical protein
MYEGLVNAHKELLREFDIMQKGADPRQRFDSTARLKHAIDAVGIMVRQISVQPAATTTPAAAAAESLAGKLIRLADLFDERGAHVLADRATEFAAITKLAYIPRMRKEDKEVGMEMRPLGEGTLSTRCCPDHRGVQAARIAERTYQCPIDGKTYNYETGYVNYKGQVVPGGSVAAQTPATSDFGGTPLRYFDDGRQNVLNNIN